MDYKDKVIELSEFLSEHGLYAESSKLLNLIQKKSSYSFKIQDWQSVIEEYNKPYSHDLVSGAIKHLSKGLQELQRSYNDLKDADLDELKATIQNIPAEKFAAALNYDILKKTTYSSDDLFVKTANICLNENIIVSMPNYKTAGWWQNVKWLGGASLRYGLPLLSIIFAIKNFYYCAVELQKLMKEMPDADLQWYDALFPEKILDSAYDNKSNPFKLREIIRATKTSKIFVDEAISLPLNIIDGVKDIIFLILNMLSLGGSLAIDLGISFMIMLGEISIKRFVLPKYDRISKFILDTATLQISKLKSDSLSEKNKSRLELIDSYLSGLDSSMS